MRALAVLVGVALLASCGGRYRAPVMPEVATRVALGPREADPIAGDVVWITVPYAWDGTCTPPVVTASPPSAEEGATAFVLEAGAGCVPAASDVSIALVRLGALDAGHYALRLGALEASFDVLPEGTDPGPLPEDWEVRLAVARRAPPGECFGMPSPAEQTPEGLRLREQSPRMFRRITRAYPDADPDALFSLARRIDVVSRGEGRWEYGYTDGACCTISERGGEVRRAADGTWDVSPPRTYSQRNVDC